MTAFGSLGIGRQWRLLTRALRERSSDRFVDAYMTSISRRVPALYLVVVFDVVLLIGSFHAVVPIWVQAIGVALAFVAGIRGRKWLPRNAALMSVQEKRRALRIMPTMGGWFALLFMLWTVVLSRFVDPEQRMMVHYVLSMTAFAAIVALAQAPRTALNVALAFSIPAFGVFLAAETGSRVQLALVQVVLTITMMVAILNNHREFVRRELTAQRLARRLASTTRESRANYHRATIDELTGGLNRRAILQHLRDALVPGTDPRPWLALVDLDGFKHVNDTYGHAAGDAVLCAVAQRLGMQAGVRAHGRLGGDEFAIVFDGCCDSDAVRAVCHSVASDISQPIVFSNTKLRVQCSIGIYRLAQTESSACLERADAALYMAKQQGNGAVVVFGPDDEATHGQRALVIRQFHDSVLEDRLRLVYQPVVDIRDGRIVGLEAFARWSPDGHSWQSPSNFMDLAEATGRMGEVTQQVLIRAIQECRPTDHAIAVSINLSPRDVVRDGVAAQLAQFAAQAGGCPENLILEVTERALLNDPQRAKRQLCALRECGFRIALDDFGAGWSSLSQLRDLPLDVIKLDGALGRALPTDPGARAVAGMIVALGWQLGLDCTIKGIETETQAQAARALGITRMQGYHFGAPDRAAVVLRGLQRAIA